MFEQGHLLSAQRFHPLEDVLEGLARDLEALAGSQKRNHPLFQCLFPKSPMALTACLQNECLSLTFEAEGGSQPLFAKQLLLRKFVLKQMELF